jgi:imidazoleglycerol-phosphate dehydratase
MNRTSTLQRQTSETNITISIDLDGTGQHEIDTGVGFFDHMLTALAVHGLFNLAIQAKGDLHIDTHHTIEDVGIVLGQALNQALGDRKGIIRTAHAYVPMDEALGFVAVDLGGRPYTVFHGTWHTPAIGQMPTDLVEHFFESVAIHARMNLHAKACGGGSW